MKIALTRRIPEPGVSRLAEAGELWMWPHDRDMTPEELLTEALDAEILASLPTNIINGRLMDARPGLKLIANFAVGFNNIDVEAARARGIIVTNTPGVLTEATADMALALMLDASRRMSEGDRLVRRGDFRGISPEFHLGLDMEDKVLGIYGLGRIGAAVTRRAQAFGLRVIYHNRRPNPEYEAELGIRYVSFEELLSESDFISINTPLTPETTHRFTLKEFGAMKDTAVLVNTGRGPIIKEDDLAEALERRMIYAAGLDVYEFEPEVNKRLLRLENVVLAPHLGSATVRTRRRMAELVADNVEAFVRGENPPNRVA